MSFDDLLASNRDYAEGFVPRTPDGVARQRLAMVTCMDSRIDPLAIVGLLPGDMKLLRNPGGRVTEDVLTALVLATHLLGVERIMIVQHTNCAMVDNTAETLRGRVAESAGRSADDLEIVCIDDQQAALAHDTRRVHEHPLLGERVDVGGFVYNVNTGLLERLV